MSFFSPSDTAFQPKRKFRFLVSFSNLGEDLQFMVTKASKPSFELSNSTEHRLLNHVFKYPGIVKWQDIDVSFIDAIEPNVGSKFYNVLKNMGYVQQLTLDNMASGITKQQADAAVGTVSLYQLDAGGFAAPTPGDSVDGYPGQSFVKYYERWDLKNAFIKSINFGDLSYDDEGIVGIDVGLSYDFAEYTAPTNGAEIPLPG